MPLDSKRRNTLIEIMPSGSLASKSWLKDQHFSEHAIDNLLKAHQLTKLGYGVYTRPGSKSEWQDVIVFLQRQLETDLTVGGLTALEVQGFAHYLSFSARKNVHLYGADQLPLWIKGVDDNVTYYRHTLGELFGKPIKEAAGVEINKFTMNLSWKGGSEGIRVSIPERAALEILSLIPENMSFEHGDELFENFSTLSPRKMQSLLELCDSVRVRRLFLWYAERHNHSWLKKLELEKVDMGSGNRVIAKGGKLNTKYKITVPANYE